MGMTIPEKVWVWEGGKYPDNNKRIWTTDEYDELGDGMWGGDYYFRGDYVEKLEANLAKALGLLKKAQTYIKDLEEHEGAEGFSRSTVLAMGEYYDALAELEKTE